ncbi:cytochrome bd-I ubiquinol oxidase subunit 2 apoprotein [Dongia mobilis]|uniref:Cytochrome bd-I ubiquinol oxidase subunit 2 apoprotein n=1 Tax=Dongia mobilis TaxID=578943 RepID=A0A4V3DF54_9PROT|nr:cytochrome d ubiquinol oxidase subunit II [Dongia mobilis]TDQ85517.1 cytochrome bd-I ubiquinol oxidase subunit 2 apoprotein [Dongia mobilis]
MLHLFGDPATWLPFTFAALMGISILVYVVLDGFDLGIGMLFALGDEAEQDRMMAAIGPFWDANETWLVLAVGLLLVAFPIAHGIILSTLYLPVALMLIGLILRGVAFEFRAKASGRTKRRWSRIFIAGSALTALTQGYMLGSYIMGLQQSPATIAFGLMTAICLVAGYVLVGATWLIIKTDGALQRRAVAWGRRALAFVALGLAAISVASPLVSPRIFGKWFEGSALFYLAPLPLGSAAILLALFLLLRRLPDPADRLRHLPFAAVTLLFILAFAGLAYSFYPYVVPERLTLYAAAAAPESLAIILWGALFVLPAILGYTALSYRIFRGKATTLSYD